MLQLLASLLVGMIAGAIGMALFKMRKQSPPPVVSGDDIRDEKEQELESIPAGDDYNNLLDNSADIDAIKRAARDRFNDLKHKKLRDYNKRTDG